MSETTQKDGNAESNKEFFEEKVQNNLDLVVNSLGWNTSFKRISEVGEMRITEVYTLKQCCCNKKNRTRKT